MFGIVWSIGAMVDTDGRAKFDAFYRELLVGKHEENPVPKQLGKLDSPFPTEHLVYDFMYEVSTVWKMCALLTIHKLFSYYTHKLNL